MAAIEAAMLYGRYQVSSLIGVERVALLIVGTVLVFLCCLLTFRNREISEAHLKRVKHIENEAAKTEPIPPFHYKKSHASAQMFLWTVTFILTTCNVWIIARLLCLRP